MGSNKHKVLAIAFPTLEMLTSYKVVCTLKGWAKPDVPISYVITYSLHTDFVELPLRKLSETEPESYDPHMLFFTSDLTWRYSGSYLSWLINLKTEAWENYPAVTFFYMPGGPIHIKSIPWGTQKYAQIKDLHGFKSLSCLLDSLKHSLLTNEPHLLPSPIKKEAK